MREKGLLCTDKILNLQAQFKKNGSKNKSVAFIFFYQCNFEVILKTNVLTDIVKSIKTHGHAAFFNDKSKCFITVSVLLTLELKHHY